MSKNVNITLLYFNDIQHKAQKYMYLKNESEISKTLMSYFMMRLSEANDNSQIIHCVFIFGALLQVYF